jgi:hypothetical protein
MRSLIHVLTVVILAGCGETYQSPPLVMNQEASITCTQSISIECNATGYFVDARGNFQGTQFAAQFCVDKVTTQGRASYTGTGIASATYESTAPNSPPSVPSVQADRDYVAQTLFDAANAYATSAGGHAIGLSADTSCARAGAGTGGTSGSGGGGGTGGSAGAPSK